MASGSGELVAHGAMQATVIHDRSGLSVTRTLTPVYGRRGFHFAANIALPGVDQAAEAVDDHGGDNGHEE